MFTPNFIDVRVSLLNLESLLNSLMKSQSKGISPVQNVPLAFPESCASNFTNLAIVCQFLTGRTCAIHTRARRAL